MTGQNEFVDKVVLSLIGKLSTNDIKLVKDTLMRVSGDYEITKVCTEIIVSEYELPDCYKMYIATKTMNGEFSSQGTIKLYEDCYAKLISDNTAVADAMFVAKLIKEVDKEHSEAYKFWLYKKATDFDIDIIICEQKDFC